MKSRTAGAGSNRATSPGGRGHPIAYFAWVRGDGEISPCLLQWQARHRGGDVEDYIPPPRRPESHQLLTNETEPRLSFSVWVLT